jgi:release factor glutamine methyltransferase
MGSPCTQNPPYVVTPSEEVGGTGISAAWAGGRDGREVLDRLLPQLPRLLSPRGVFYLLALEANVCAGRPDSLYTALPGFDVARVLQRSAGIERLSVFRYTRGVSL